MTYKLLSWTLFSHGRTICVRLLIDAGADLEAKNRDGVTPIVTAATTDRGGNRAEIARILLDAGADPTRYKELLDERERIAREANPPLEIEDIE